VRDIRADANLAAGAPIPTVSFLIWLWHRVGLLTIVVVFLVAALVVPVALLWTRDMNRGYQAVITVILLISILVTTFIVGSAMLFTDSRGLHLRHDMFKAGPKIRSNRKHVPPIDFRRDVSVLFSWTRSGWAVILIVVTVACVAPLAALWTKPLQMGIKIGTTIAQGLLYVCCIIYILLKSTGSQPGPVRVSR